MNEPVPPSLPLSTAVPAAAIAPRPMAAAALAPAAAKPAPAPSHAIPAVAAPAAPAVPVHHATTVSMNIHRVFFSSKTPQNLPLHPELRQKINELEEWVKANEKEIKTTKIKFWLLKTPVILITASTPVFAYFDLKSFAVLAGSAATILVGIESQNPYRDLKANQQLALYDLRQLQGKIENDWKVGCFKERPQNELLADIFEYSRKEEQRISDYLKPSRH